MATITILGRQGEGWMTMQAKEYPAKMCEILAETYLIYFDYAQQLTEEEKFASHKDFKQLYIQCLCGQYDPYFCDHRGSEMKADYYKSKRSTQ